MWHSRWTPAIREVVTWCAGAGAIGDEMIRDLMLQSVEQRQVVKRPQIRSKAIG